MGIKDRHTGQIKSRADWSILHPWSRSPRPRVMFFCNPCWEAVKEAWGSPMPGLTPPKGASDFWRPSITEHIRLTGMEIRRREQSV